MSIIGCHATAPRRPEAARSTRTLVQRLLLACGIGYGAAYVFANDGVGASMWESYSRLDQAISELSGTEAPSRGFLAGMLPIFTLLVLGFGIGVWRAAGPSRALRVTGAILVAQAIMFPVWLLFPMTSRDEIAQGAGGANDVGHMVLSALAVLFIISQMGFSAAALGRRFRYFSIAMAITAVAAGAFVATTTDDIAAGDPTPWMGLVERVSYGAWLVWMAVLAAVLLRRTGDGSEAPTERALAGT